MQGDPKVTQAQGDYLSSWCNGESGLSLVPLRQWYVPCRMVLKRAECSASGKLETVFLARVALKLEFAC